MDQKCWRMGMSFADIFWHGGGWDQKLTKSAKVLNGRPNNWKSSRGGGTGVGPKPPLFREVLIKGMFWPTPFLRKPCHSKKSKFTATNFYVFAFFRFFHFLSNFSQKTNLRLSHLVNLKKVKKKFFCTKMANSLQQIFTFLGYTGQFFFFHP